jgi:molybdate transport system ATP-binding protein
VRLPSGAEVVAADPLPGTDVAVAVRPQAVILSPHRPEGSARNAWRVTVVDLEADHDRVRVRLTGPVELVSEVTPASVAELGLTPGQDLWASVKAVDLAVYER